MAAPIFSQKRPLPQKVDTARVKPGLPGYKCYSLLLSHAGLRVFFSPIQVEYKVGIELQYLLRCNIFRLFYTQDMEKPNNIADKSYINELYAKHLS